MYIIFGRIWIELRVEHITESIFVEYIKLYAPVTTGVLSIQKLFIVYECGYSIAASALVS